MNAEQLAQQLVELLRPVLPMLLQAGGGIAQDFVNRVGHEVWAKAKSVWQLLWPKIQTNPSAKEATADASGSPEDEDTWAALRLQLKKLLTGDPDLLGEVGRLLGSQIDQTVVAERGSTVSTIEQNAGTSRNLSQSVRATDNSKVDNVKQEGNQ